MKIYEAEKLIRENKISPKELLQSVMENITDKEEKIGAYITVCNMEDSLNTLSENKSNSPLWGIPIAIKDNLCTKHVLTTAASKILENFIPPYDATVVKKLKDSGVIITGKTNMDEFSMGSECKFSAFKKTSNPTNYSFVPGGSSGGSAAAVKSGMALGALGTDTGGSIRQPAAFCGLYGLKPTYSLVSRFGLIAFASSLDTIGPICQSAMDTAIMIDAIKGKDPFDSTTAHSEGSLKDQLTADVRNIKIGVIKELFDYAEDSVKNALKKAVKDFESMGAEVCECSLNSVKYAVSAYYIISSSEASSNLARFDGVRFGKRCPEYASLEEMYIKTRSENFGSEVKKRILLGTYVLSEKYYDKYYLKAKSAQADIKSETEKLFEKFDILLTPVSGKCVWKKGSIPSSEEIYKNDICTLWVNLGGNPAISVPCGKDENNMPIGMQIVGKPFGEATILNAAWAYERGGFNRDI